MMQATEIWMVVIFLIFRFENGEFLEITCNSYCNCDDDTITLNERKIACPGVTIRVESRLRKVKIECEENEDPAVFSNLTGLLISGMKIDQLSIDRCPHPPTSFMTLLADIGVEHVADLSIKSAGGLIDKIDTKHSDKSNSVLTLRSDDVELETASASGTIQQTVSYNEVSFNEDDLNSTADSSTPLSETALHTSPQQLLKKPALPSSHTKESYRTRPPFPIRFLSNLTALENVNISFFRIKNLTEEAFSRSTNLTTIVLSDNEMETIAESTFATLERLHYLDLSENQMSYLLENLFSKTTELKQLYLNHNKLELIPEKLFYHLSGLHTLDLAHNRLKSLEGNQFVNLINLKTLNISGNQLISLLQNPLISDYDHSVLHNCKNLRELQLSDNSLTEIYEDWELDLTVLETLNLSFNAFTKFKVGKSDVLTDLSHNHITDIDYFVLSKSVENARRPEASCINVSFNPLNCSCKFINTINFFLAFTLNTTNFGRKLLSFENVKCQDPAELKDRLVESVVETELKRCFREGVPILNENCPYLCTCTNRTFRESYLVVNCQHSELRRPPKWLPVYNHSNHTELNLYNNSLEEFRMPTHAGYRRVTHLNLANNNISSIHISRACTRLKKLDLSHNNLQELSNETLEVLEPLELERLELHGNPWHCDCQAKRLIQFVQARKHLIKYHISCEDGTSMMSISDPCLRETLLSIYLVSATTTAVVLLTSALALTLLYSKYRRQVRVYCYSSRWGVLRWLVSLPVDEEDKEYDAFVSFSHEDDDFVMNHLVPFLEETGERRYKLCLHYRDWMPGEMIPSQIVRSVKNSRRTIVVLSPHFLESVWGVIEFRTAHSVALREGTTKVIVILHKDVGPTDALDEELRVYLQTNTYIKWGTRWFWRQLAYAMPHTTVTNKKTH